MLGAQFFAFSALFAVFGSVFFAYGFIVLVHDFLFRVSVSAFRVMQVIQSENFGYSHVVRARHTVPATGASDEPVLRVFPAHPFNQSSSLSVNVSGPERLALSTFSTTCCIVLIPLRATETSGWFHTHWSAHSARDRLVSASSHMA